MPFERIPAELKSLRQWHCWLSRDGTKIPTQVDGQPAKSNDPQTWSDFETACDASAYQQGLAFEIAEPYTGIDLDNCIDDDGNLRPWAVPIVSRLDGLAYMEISPSGKGIKLLTRARKSDGSKCVHKIGPEKQQIECYDHARFWTVTDNAYAQQYDIGDGQQQVDWLCENYLTGESQKTATVKHTPAAPRSNFGALMNRAVAYVATVPGESKGNLRNASFSLAGHLHSLVDEFGGRLTDDEVHNLLRDWNQKNTPPLRDDELQESSVNGRTNGTPRADKVATRNVDLHPEVNISKLLGEERTDDFDDEEFIKDSIPETGLLRQIYEYHFLTAHRFSQVMALATAVSLCETLFGRRIASHTDLRTNDYNVIMAPTTSGKESCETTITKILASYDITKMPMIPPDVQSGNGLIKALSQLKGAIWICDEFGKVLEAILDKKGNGHIKQIGTHLLKLYGKSAGVYGGAAHADGVRNQIGQPHLCLLGLTTGQIFDTIDGRQIQDGLLGRIAFWPVQDRPPRRSVRAVAVPDDLAAIVRQWIEWVPSGLNPDDARPVIIEMTADSVVRWENHADAIDAKMNHESESRSAVWGRVAARAMKLALVHRASRIAGDPGKADWAAVTVELQDVDWGIRLANWLGRVTCGLIRENVVDLRSQRASQIILTVLAKVPGIRRSALLREYRSISCSEFSAAAEELQAAGVIEICGNPDQGVGRKTVVYKMANFNKT